MKFFRFGFWLFLILFAALLILNLLGIWPPPQEPEPQPQEPEPELQAFTPEDVQASVVDQSERIRDLYKKQGFQEIAEDEDLYYDNSKLITPDGELKEGRDGIREFYESLWEKGVRDIEFKPEKIDVECEFAFVFGTYTFTFEGESQTALAATGNFISSVGHREECPWPPLYQAYTAY